MVRAVNSIGEAQMQILKLGFRLSEQLVEDGVFLTHEESANKVCLLMLDVALAGVCSGLRLSEEDSVKLRDKVRNSIDVLEEYFKQG